MSPKNASLTALCMSLGLALLCSSCVEGEDFDDQEQDSSETTDLVLSGYAGPELLLPMKPGGKVPVTTQVGGSPTHSGNSYFSVDFNDRISGDVAVAAAAGTVAKVVGGSNECGIRTAATPSAAACGVTIDHGGGYTTKYLHLAQGTIVVTQGQQVTRGQTLGVIGTTGESDGTHLHFEVKYDGAGNDGHPALEGVRVDGRLLEDYKAGQQYASTNGGTTAYEYAGATTCGAYSGPNADWTYNCLGERADFVAGERAYALMHLRNIRPFSHHRFRVEIFRDRARQWGWDTGVNQVGQYGWQHAYFWPDIGATAPGEWEFRLFVETSTRPGDYVYVGFKKIQVVQPAANYLYGGGEACLRVLGPDASWVYRCELATDVFVPNTQVMALFTLREIWVNHRFKARVYRAGAFQWETSPTAWNQVDPQWGWRNAYYWTSVPVGSVPGAWRVDLYVDDGSGFRLVGDKAFTVQVW